jgi:5-methylcytosine-specific restriction endonuclease McrA
MPIREENKARYPKDWPAISKAIRDEAQNQCQQCGAPNGEIILRGTNENYAPAVCYAVVCGIGAHVYDATTGALLDACPVSHLQGWKPVRVVLTVAHLDHQPENCDPENLRAWCQRCHNRYDQPMRKAGVKHRARLSRAAADLFGDS